jgi:hypothetical protein
VEENSTYQSLDSPCKVFFVDCLPYAGPSNWLAVNRLPSTVNRVLARFI